VEDEKSEILTDYASRAKSQIESAEIYAQHLGQVIAYVRTDHVGMIRGDGDLTRYISFLTRMVTERLNAASANINAANIPDELPF